VGPPEERTRTGYSPKRFCTESPPEHVDKGIDPMALSIHSGRPLVTLALLALGIALRPAQARTDTASFGVSVTVDASCQVSYGIDRGDSSDNISPLSVRCTHPVPYHVTVGAEQSMSPPLPVLETQRLGPAGGRLVPVPTVPTFLRWDRAGAPAMTRTGTGSAPFFSMEGGSAGPHHLPSIANPEAIVITVVY